MCVQLCLTLCNPMDCIPLGSFVHGILQARILEWVAVLPVQGSNSGVLQLQADFLLSEPLGKPFLTMLSITLSNFPGTHYTSLLHFSPCPIPSPPQGFFIYEFWLGWVFFVVWACLSGRLGLLRGCIAQASRVGHGLSGVWFCSSCGSQAQEHSLSSCGAQA